MKNDNDVVDYGPLGGLIGRWFGERGVDVAPEPDGAEENPYYETIVITPAGTVTNAESQTLAVLHYHQVVSRRSNDRVFHNQTGYWMWDAASGEVTQSLAIPRAVCALATGSSRRDGDSTVLSVAARAEDAGWAIAQSPFMLDNARTVAYQLELHVHGDTLNYRQTTVLDIYGSTFEHTDQNALRRED